MTWDKIIPEPVDSLTALLLLAGTVLPVAFLTAIVLFGDRRYWLATGTYGLGLVTVFNGLVAYDYTPRQIMTRWNGDSWEAYVAAVRLALVNYVAMNMFIILTILLMVILFRTKHDSLALMWLGVGAVEDFVGTLYAHYAAAATALTGASPLPRPISGWASAFWLSIAGASFVAAAALRWRRVPVAVLRKVAMRRASMSSLRVGDHVDFTVPPSQFLQQRFRAPAGEYREVVPYGIPRFRNQQRRWRRSKYLYAVFMYGMQFYAPPMPPDYRYYEFHEFL